MAPFVLLGAGASHDAGIPISTEMTEKLVEAINERHRWGQETQALNFVCGALMAYDAAQGDSPYTGLDVERVISAIDLLAERRDLEVTPFVASWHPAVDAWDRPRVASFAGRNLQDALEKDHHGGRIEQVIGGMIDSRTKAGDGTTYRVLARSMTAELRRLLETDAQRAAYLKPIADAARREGGITVATLNYDTSVEQVAEATSVPVYTGLDEWTSHREWGWPTSGLRLLKLHGSINWCWNDTAAPGDLGISTVSRTLDVASETRSPALIFGQREKLSAKGPFLSLLAEFERLLEQAEHLLVVGYSFRDNHVNEVIRHWAADDLSRRITIVDPSLPTDEYNASPGIVIRRFTQARPNFRQRLLALNTSDSVGTATATSRVEVVPQSAVSALAEYLAEGV